MPTRVRLRQCPDCRAVQRASAYVLLEDLGSNPLRACPAYGWIGSTRALRIVGSAKRRRGASLARPVTSVT